jgi:hypothetical protein
MTNGGQRPDPSRFQIETEMDLLFGRAHPNPNREGCPPADMLRRLARRELPIGDVAYDHFAKCSPCYVELRSIQQADAAVAATRRRRQMLAAAAMLVLVVGAAWFALRGTGTTDRPAASSGEPVQQLARLDLRPFAVTRSEQRTDEPAAFVLPRSRLDAVIWLPVGAEPGAYELQILDANSQPRTTATGTAAIRDYVMTLEARLELDTLTPGEYKLALRRPQADWRLYPVVIK